MGHFITKSRYLSSLQCPKRLWFETRGGGGRDDPVRAVRLAWGQRVGEQARALLPDAVLIDRERLGAEGAAGATAAAIAAGARRLCEASFLVDGVYVATDLLAKGRGGWTLTEVKSTTSVKGEHLPDLAVQAWALGRAGLDLRKAEVLHLDGACRHPDLAGLFARADVTDEVRPLLGEVPGRVRAARAVLDGPLPEVAVGDHCQAPWPCPFQDRCWPTRPVDGIDHLYRGEGLQKALAARGVARLGDIPGDVPLTPIQARQRRAARGRRCVVERGLGAALRRFAPPLGYLDFETVQPPIPMWPGCRPYEAVPVQFVCRAPGPDGRERTRAFLAAGPEDPRPALAHALVEACACARTVFAYYAAFERRCIAHLAEHVPALAGPLALLGERIEDLLPLVRDHVYHLGFRGSFSIKDVLPTLFPALAYSDLEVAEGGAAAALLERMLFLEPDMPSAERRRHRRALERYCRRDVEGLRALHLWLLDHP